MHYIMSRLFFDRFFLRFGGIGCKGQQDLRHFHSTQSFSFAQVFEEVKPGFTAKGFGVFINRRAIDGISPVRKVKPVR